MAKTITRKIKLDFESTNLDKIAAQLDEYVNFLPDNKKTQTFINEFKQKLLSLKTVLDSSGGLFSEEGFKQVQKKIKEIARDFASIPEKFDLSKMVGTKVEAERKKLQKEVQDVENEIEKTEDKIRELSSKLRIREQTPDLLTRQHEQEVFKSAIDSGKIEAPTSIYKNVDVTTLQTAREQYEEMLELLKEHGVEKEKFLEMTKEELDDLDKILYSNALESKWKTSMSTIQENGLKLSKAEEVLEKERLKLVEERLKTEGKMRQLIDQDLPEKIEAADKAVLELTNSLVEMGEGELAEVIRMWFEFSETLNNNVSRATGKAKDEFLDLKNNLTDVKKPTREIEKETKKIDSTFGKAAKNVFAYGTAYSFLKRIYRETIRTIKELDKALTDMAVVTTMSRKETWALRGTFQDLARETGMTTTEIANLSTIYFRQGRALKDVIELTEVAAKAARIAGISAEESANYLTAAINGFGLAAKEAERMSDKFAALAASSASSYEELAVGLSKFASQANLAGLSVDFALGLLAKGVETTREAPESIGTALKTVLARMRELTDLGKTMEDGMDVNRVDKALKDIGVSLRDASGEFRDMESVLTEVGSKWNTLTKNQRANVAVSLAGTRQQSRLVAIFQDFDRTLELVQTSLDSEGATLAQHMNYMEGIEAATTKLTTAWQSFVTSIVESELVIGIISVITGAVEGLSNIMGAWDGRIGKLILSFAILLAAMQAQVAIQKTLAALKEKDLLLSMRETAQKMKEFVVRMLNHNARKKDAIIRQREIQYMQTEIMLRTMQITALNRETGAQITNTLATKAGTIASWSATAAAIAMWAAMTLGISLVISLLPKIIDGFKKLFKQIFKKGEHFKEQQNELKKYRYELGQLHKTNQSLIDQAEENRNILFVTEEDLNNQEELRASIKEQMESLKEQKIITEDIVYDVQGRVDIEKNIEIIQKSQKKLIEDQKKTTDDLIKSLKEEYKWRVRSGKLDKLQDYRKFFEENKSVFEAYALSIDFGDASPETKDAYLKLANSFMDSLEGQQYGDFLSGLYDGFLENSLLAQAKEVQKIRETLSGYDTYEEQIENYKKLTKDLTEAQKDLLDTEFKALKIFGELEQDILRGVAFSAEKAQEAVSAVGIDNFDSFLKAVGSGSIEEWYDAIEEFSEGDKKIKEALWAFATHDAQKVITAYDTLASRMENVNKKQEDFWNGNMSLTESMSFLEEHLEILENEDFYELFSKRGDTSLYYANELLKEGELLQENLDKLKERQALGEEGLEPEIRKLELLLQYRGEFANLTKAQIQYNDTKKQETLLSKLGLLDEEKMIELQQKRYDGARENMAELQKRSEVYLDKIDSYGQNLYEIIDGVAVINQENFEKLSNLQKKNVNQWMDSYNKGMLEQVELFSEMMNAELEIVKKANEKKRKNYEKYFEALDRLENRRERKLSREEITQQLQRLEGASDERSRQRAKELRKELADFDKQTAKDMQKQSREDLFESLNQEVTDFEQKIADLGADFISAMGEGAQEFMEVLYKGGFPRPNESTSGGGGGGSSGGGSDRFQLKMLSAAKGGLIDYTGLAMLHGTSTRPEAVLTQDQTIAFKQLAQNLDTNFSSSGGITLGNIIINTQSLDNTQDFKAAGRALAKEFEAAIARRGIGVNAKR